MSIPELSVKKATVREILAKDSIAEAIKQLKQLLPPTSSKLEDLILIEARQNETNRNRLRGVLDDRELQLTYNRIREDLLALIDSLQDSDFDPSQARSKIAPSKKARRGHVLHRIPNKMRHLEETRCVVRIALDDSTIIENIDLDEHVQLQSVRISDLMQVELLDPADEPAFAIRSINTPEQFIDEDEYTEWQFFVKPLRTGTFPLLLKVAVIELVYGKERQREIVLEQAVDIVNVPTQEQVEFQSTGQLFDFSASRNIGADANPSDLQGTPPNLNPLRGAFARRAALSLATLMSCVGGAWAVTPTQVKWKAEVEWVATRYLLDNQSAYERYIRRHDQSQHYEMAVWQKTEIVDEPEAYVDYLEEFPEAEAAREDWQLPKLEKIIYQVVSQSTDTAYLRLYLKAFPKGKDNENRRKQIQDKLESVQQIAAARTEQDSTFLITGPTVVTPITEVSKRNDELESDQPLAEPIISELSSKVDEANNHSTQPERSASDEDLDENTWTTIKDTKELQPFQDYLSQFSQGKYRNEALLKIEEIKTENQRLEAVREEDLAWNTAKKEHTINSYDAYLEAYPRGKYVMEAKSRKSDLENAATKKTTAAALILKKGTAALGGKTYSTIQFKANGLTWMTQNLDYEVENSAYHKDLKSSERSKYGRLYTWEAAKKACQAVGWRLPTDQEWREMAKAFGGADDDASDGGKAAYQALIAGGSSGFSAQLGGGRHSNGDFGNLGDNGYYWSATEYGSDLAWNFYFYRGDGELGRSSTNKTVGRSCRCVQE